jgi:hypothetical protein
LNAVDFLTRLEKVKRTAEGEWLACCPAHDDKSPSLAVKEASDGRILVHCFAGCSFEEVCNAVSVKMEELFPDTGQRMKSEGLRPLPWNPRTVLKALTFNAHVVAILAADIAEGRPVSPADMDTAYRIKEEFEEAVRVISR